MMLGMWKQAQKVAELVMEHVAQIRVAMDAFFQSTKAFLEDRDRERAETLATETHRAESEADDIRRRVEQKLLAGVLLAASRRQILEIMEQVDRLASSAQTALNYLLVQHVQIPPDILPLLLEILAESKTVFADVECGLKALFAGDRAQTSQCMTRIDQCESRVDKIEQRASRALFNMNLDLAHKMHVQSLIRSVVEISDRAQDLADSITRITAERAF